MAARSSLVVGTRGSRLAVQQAEWVQARLREVAPGVTVALQRIKTSGDMIVDVPLAAIGGEGVFVKENEEGVLRGEIDLSVHSKKDVPAIPPDGFGIFFFPGAGGPPHRLLRP